MKKDKVEEAIYADIRQQVELGKCDYPELMPLYEELLFQDIIIDSIQREAKQEREIYKMLHPRESKPYVRTEPRLKACTVTTDAGTVYHAMLTDKGAKEVAKTTACKVKTVRVA